MTRKPTIKGAMRALGYRWNYLQGQARCRYQSEKAFIWQLEDGKWVGRRRVQGNMHNPEVFRDIRNWNTWKYGPTDSPVAIAMQIELEG